MNDKYEFPDHEILARYLAMLEMYSLMQDLEHMKEILKLQNFLTQLKTCLIY